MCTARLQAVGRPKPSLIRPSRAGPKSGPDHSPGPGFMSLLIHHRYQCILTLGSRIVCYRLPWTSGHQSLPQIQHAQVRFIHARRSMYDRAHLASKPLQISTGLRYRFETLIGVTGYKMAKYRPRWLEVLMMAGSSNGIFGCRLASSVFLRSSL
ncbi:uncharacterized protein F5147DRAFT_418508 [Suillus discolor]|uniref:Uncharacterized protein n=1 Tax=Suillus discolor TaxID=1912936 RepID=A0A9P7JNZ3_9AGAM|nr:uncharacterized protein F5147DRAFT_418508 [Suillus discolor]KAG2094030.1 hypothetical protein F5147DRAFT_418508 [Suillus discolor]